MGSPRCFLKPHSSFDHCPCIGGERGPHIIWWCGYFVTVATNRTHFPFTCCQLPQQLGCREDSGAMTLNLTLVDQLPQTWGHSGIPSFAQHRFLFTPHGPGARPDGVVGNRWGRSDPSPCRAYNKGGQVDMPAAVGHTQGTLWGTTCKNTTRQLLEGVAFVSGHLGLKPCSDLRAVLPWARGLTSLSIGSLLLILHRIVMRLELLILILPGLMQSKNHRTIW